MRAKKHICIYKCTYSFFKSIRIFQIFKSRCFYWTHFFTTKRERLFSCCSFSLSLFFTITGGLFLKYLCDICKHYGNDQGFHICYLSDDVLTKKKKRCKDFDERISIPEAYDSPNIILLEEIIKEGSS